MRLAHRLIFCAALSGPLCGLSRAQSIVYVNANLSTGANDGSSWADAFQGSSGLQAALAVTSPGDSVYVAEGTYRPTELGDTEESFWMQDEVAWYGGFLGGEASPAERPPFDSAPSILLGDLLGDDANGPGSFDDNSGHLVRSQGNPETTILDGFRIVGGAANKTGPPVNRRGGGILINGGSLARIRNCRFLGNRAQQNGGAAYIRGGPVFTNCRFEDNLAPEGGAISCGDITTPGPEFIGCNFADNRASIRGGAVHTEDQTSARIDSCSFVRNEANTTGGALALLGIGDEVSNCLIAGNISGQTGSAMIVGGILSGDTRVYNCTIFGNSASFGPGVHVTGSFSVNSFINCVLWGNVDLSAPQQAQQQISPGAVITYSIVQGGLPGQGNLNIDPDLRNPDQGDYRLGFGSPAIDAGSNSAPFVQSTDLAGNPRMMDDPSVQDSGNGTSPIVDMGAYEALPAEEVGETDPGCTPVINSTGLPADLSAYGSLSVTTMELALAAQDMPLNQPSILLVSESAGSLPFGAGVLCLGSPFTGYSGSVLNTGSLGAVVFKPELNSPPIGLQLQAGETWYFQAWFRDAGASTNLTDSLSITWQ